MKRTCKSTEIDLKEEEDRIYSINFLTRPIFAVLRPPFAIILSLSLSLSLCLSVFSTLNVFLSLCSISSLPPSLSLSLLYRDVLQFFFLICSLHFYTSLCKSKWKPMAFQFYIQTQEVHTFLLSPILRRATNSPSAI